jgi:hypothetical protein
MHQGVVDLVPTALQHIASVSCAVGRRRRWPTHDGVAGIEAGFRDAAWELQFFRNRAFPGDRKSRPASRARAAPVPVEARGAERDQSISSLYADGA